MRSLYRATLGKDWNILEVLPTPKQPKRLPVVPSAGEVARFLDAVPNRKHHAILTTCYAAGLRISETVQLRPRDIDSRHMVIRVEQGKGAKDRCVMLSPRLRGWRQAAAGEERCWRASRWIEKEQIAALIGDQYRAAV